MVPEKNVAIEHEKNNNINETTKLLINKLEEYDWSCSETPKRASVYYKG
jgi:hypothetical protein